MVTTTSLPPAPHRFGDSTHFKSHRVEQDLPEKNPPRFLGLRRSAIIETLVFIAAVLFIDALFLEGDRLLGVALHPFLFIIMLISAQYGSSEGIAATILCTIALYLGNMPAQSLDQDWYDYLFMITKWPMLWFVVALILGELRLRHMRERDMLRQMIEDANEREHTITDAYRKLQGHKQTLETRIASQMKSGLSVYRAGMALETLEPEDVVVGIGEMVHSLTHADKFSVFLLQHESLNAVMMENWEEEDAFPKQYASNSSLYREIVGRRKLLCIVNEDDRAVLADHGMMAGALRNKDTGEVIGMLKIEDTPFRDINLTSIETFRMLCDWIGTTYTNARRYQTARDESLVNPDIQMLSSSYLKLRTDFLKALARRAGFDVTMVLLRVDNADELGSEGARDAAITLGQAVQVNLRQIDQAFDYSGDDWDFAIVLPYTPASNAHIVLNKIRKALDKKLAGVSPKPHYSHEIRAIYSHNADSDDSPETSDEPKNTKKRK